MTHPEREIRTVGLMIGLYCRRHHGEKELCGDCRELAAYAEGRTRKCPFGEEKPACSRCPTHCYRPEMKARIREVMRFAGPKMIYRHPLLAIRHLFGR
jgi:hypothetical protein